MASSVHFKFKSQKEPTRVPFDGTGISVFDLKREIISVHKLGDGTDFELAIYNESTNEKYEDDTTIIPRSTSIIAKRLPARQPGKGGAARYVSGKAPVNAKTQSRQDAVLAKSKASKAMATSDMVNAQTEEERMAAFLNLKDEQWREKQQEMANQKPVFANYRGGKRPNVPEGEPPHGYICYRCGQKGHWIQACPTNDDPNYEGHIRIRRTTGIPKTFLTKIEKPDLLDGNTDVSKMQGVMVNADGDFVIAHSDEKTWKQFQENAKASAAAQKAAAAVDNKELQERGLECPLDKKLFVDPMKTPCCGKTYCENCITNALIENDLVCPACQTENVLIDNLVEDEEVRRKIKAFEEEKAKVKQEQDNGSTPNDASSPNTGGVKAEAGSKSPTSSNSDKPKKRTADQADNAPAMKRQRSNDTPISTTTPQPNNQVPPQFPFMSMPPDFGSMASNAGLPNMNGFPSMPFMPMPGGMPSGMPKMPTMNMGMNMNMMNPMMNPMMMPSNGQSFNGAGNGWNNGVPFPNGGMANGFANGIMPNSNGNNNNNNMYNHQPNRNQSYLQNQNQNRQNTPKGLNRPPPSGPAAMQNKFSNQQRYMGKEEDQPYQRQALNPARMRHRVNKTRETDFKEL